VELSQMQRRIEEELYKLGFPKEDRKFSPHLTIGRAKSPKNMEKLVELIEKTDFKTEEVTVTEVVVMKSQLHPLGAIYTPMKKINLLS
jgi:2'-5' RNA ligase